jgi:hypothetical protein
VQIATEWRAADAAKMHASAEPTGMESAAIRSTSVGHGMTAATAVAATTMTATAASAATRRRDIGRERENENRDNGKEKRRTRRHGLLRYRHQAAAPISLTIAGRGIILRPAERGARSIGAGAGGQRATPAP